MRVDEREPCQFAFELHVLPCIVEAGAVVRVGAFDEHRYREQGGDEYRLCHSCHLRPLGVPERPTTRASIVSLFSNGPSASSTRSQWREADRRARDRSTLMLAGATPRVTAMSLVTLLLDIPSAPRSVSRADDTTQKRRRRFTAGEGPTTGPALAPAEASTSSAILHLPLLRD
jgi:hypothetical protein